MYLVLDLCILDVARVFVLCCRKIPVREINLEKLLSELGISQQEFIDLCILLGCDYCDSIKGECEAGNKEYVHTHTCTHACI